MSKRHRQAIRWRNMVRRFERFHRASRLYPTVRDWRYSVRILNVEAPVTPNPSGSEPEGRSSA